MNDSKDQPSIIAVVGCGTWGITLASVLCWKSYTVRGWDIAGELIDLLNKERRNPKLPELEVPGEIELSTDLNDTLRGCESIVIATTSAAMREVMGRLKEAPARPPHPIYTICTKGLEIESLMPMAEVAIEVLGEDQRNSVGVLSGPSHAEEVSRKLPTTVVASSEDPAVAQYIQRLFLTPEFRTYTQDDMLGVELGGSLKNVIAIASGVCDGLGFGDNSRAALITRGLAEMIRLGAAMGAKASTLSGLAGMGDLIVTATSRHSRNRKFGELLTKCDSVDQALKEVGMVVEGIPTARAAIDLALKHSVEMPITQEVAAIVYEGKDPRQAVRDLMGREARPEIY
jgi:glycerol-3-phosphate dehydrogenase (NAD(P)+)